jgi:hypothetical protein
VQLFVASVDDDGTVPVLAYVGDSERTARDLIAEAYTAAQKNSDGGADVMAWLANFLGSGPQWSSVVERAHTEAEITASRLATAKKKLGVTSHRVGGNGHWYMRLPQHLGRYPEGDPPPDPDLPESG